MTRTILTLGAILILGAAAQAADQPLKTIEVFGEATRTVAPDYVDWRLEIMVQDKDLKAAKTLSDEQLTAIFEVGRYLGLDEENIELGRVSIEKVFDWDDRGNQRSFRHFRLNRTVILHEKDLARFEEFFDALILQSDIVASMSYGISEPEAINDELRLEALKNARTKARAMAAEVEAELGAALRVSEYQPSGPGRPMDEMMYASPMVMKTSGSAVPEKQDFSVRVYATFELK
jgi:uncharacterized protein YggE